MLMKSSSRKQSVAQRFSRAAAYDKYANVHPAVAARVAVESKERLPHSAPRVLEIGCGTGNLSAALLEDFPRGRFLFSDLSAEMIDRCRDRFPERAFLQMDGEDPPLSGGFDLIASSLVMQWFADLPTGIDRLGRLLDPGGLLAFSTLGNETFKEWRSLLEARNLPCGTPRYPTGDRLRSLGLEVIEERIEVPYANLGVFLQCLKGMGAGEAAPGHRPIGPGQLRRLLKGGAGQTITWHVLYGFLIR